MASSFKGIDLFGSGPHRFMIGKQGEVVVGLAFGSSPQAGSLYLGLGELDITVTGRLVASSESALWTLRDNVVAQLVDPPTSGTLIDLTGRSWANMSFITYTEDDRTDRGRVKSVGYVAVFRRFLSPP